MYLGDGLTEFQLELTWLRDRKEPYNLGECEFHLAFHTDEYEQLHQKHQDMGCICFENPAMGIYLISDPDAIGSRSCRKISKKRPDGCSVRSLFA